MSLRAEDLDGVIPPVVTPFGSGGDVDEAAFRAEVEYVARFPVGGLLVGAATGEGFALEPDETAALCRVAKDVVGSRLPVLAGVVEASTRRAITKANAAAAAGADAVMVTPVTYLPDSDASVIGHFAEVGAASPVPLMVYDAMAHNRITPATAVALARTPEVIGVKLGYGAASLHDLRIVLDGAGGHASVMWSQDQYLLPGYCLGARGSLSTVDAIVPGHTTRLLEAVRTGDLAEARRLDAVVSALGGTLGPSDLPSAAKAAIELQGRRVGVARAPYAPIEGERLERIRSLVGEAGVLAA